MRHYLCTLVSSSKRFTVTKCPPPPSRHQRVDARCAANLATKRGIALMQSAIDELVEDGFDPVGYTLVHTPEVSTYRIDLVSAFEPGDYNVMYSISRDNKKLAETAAELNATQVDPILAVKPRKPVTTHIVVGFANRRVSKGIIDEFITEQVTVVASVKTGHDDANGYADSEKLCVVDSEHGYALVRDGEIPATQSSAHFPLWLGCDSKDELANLLEQLAKELRR